MAAPSSSSIRDQSSWYEESQKFSSDVSRRIDELHKDIEDTLAVFSKYIERCQLMKLELVSTLVNPRLPDKISKACENCERCKEVIDSALSITSNLIEAVPPVMVTMELTLSEDGPIAMAVSDQNHDNDHMMKHIPTMCMDLVEESARMASMPTDQNSANGRPQASVNELVAMGANSQ